MTTYRATAIGRQGFAGPAPASDGNAEAPIPPAGVGLASRALDARAPAFRAALIAGATAAVTAALGVLGSHMVAGYMLVVMCAALAWGRRYAVASLAAGLATFLVVLAIPSWDGPAARHEDLVRLVSGIIVGTGLIAIACRFRALWQRSERQVADAKFLDTATEALHRSLGYTETLSAVCRLALPRFGDACVLYEQTEDGGLQRVAGSHRDAAADTVLASLIGRRLNSDAALPVLSVLVEGRSRILGEDGIAAARAATMEAEETAGSPLADTRSALLIPLQLGDLAVGVVSFTSHVPGFYTRHHVSLGEELARRCALAIQNARLYQREVRTQRELREANRAKDEFLGLISHELRTPITIIRGDSRLIARHWDVLSETERAEVIGDLESEGERLQRYIEDLLTLSRLERGVHVETEPVLLRHVIEDVVRREQARHPERQFALSFPATPSLAAAHPVFLEGVLANLVGNACKYTPDETLVEVSIGRDAGGRVVTCVRDHGPGVEPGEVSHLFDAFYRGSRTATTARGTGLGLTLCRRLVEAQDGSIWATLPADGGLAVSFALAACADDPDADDETAGIAPAHPATPVAAIA